MSLSTIPQWQEFQGKTVDDATAEGLRRLGLRADAAMIEVVTKGSRGLFGLGSEPAVVRIAPKPVPVSASESAPPAPTSPVNPPAPPPQTVPSVDVQEPVYETPADLQTELPIVEAAEAAADDEIMKEVAPADATAARVSDEELALLSTELLQTMVRLMGFSATVRSEWRTADAITSDRHLLLNLHGQNLSPLIGRRGDTLENIQYLLRLMVNQKVHRWLNIVVDVDGFRAKRVEHLTQLAHRMADQVASTGRAFSLEPMPPNERRIIHLALRDDQRVVTESIGEDERRKVTIAPLK
jgi:spoIIIJ-associated protein